jgi:hypothetical protein
MAYGVTFAMVCYGSPQRVICADDEGSYPASCDSSRNYEDIPTILKDYGQEQLVDYMSTMWLV